MDEKHVIAARYIELNPVRAGLVSSPAEYQWSSCKAHLRGKDNILTKVKPLLEIVPDWSNLLASGLSTEDYEDIRQHERTGRPLGNDTFLDRLENITSRVLRKKKPGPKKKIHP